jgi:hypothetical protein
MNAAAKSPRPVRQLPRAKSVKGTHPLASGLPLQAGRVPTPRAAAPRARRPRRWLVYSLPIAAALLGGAVALVEFSVRETAQPAVSAEAGIEEASPVAETAPPPPTMETKPVVPPESDEVKAVEAPREPEQTPSPAVPIEKAAPAVPLPAPRNEAPREKFVPVPTAADKLDAQALARLIDSEVQKKLDSLQMKSAPLADDAEFLRRVYLDLHGIIPTAAQATAFLDSKSPDKRAKLIDELLASEHYGRNQGDIWFRLLVNGPREKIPVGLLRAWLVKQFNANRPWDQLASELITATGPVMADSPAMIYMLRANTTLNSSEITNIVTSRLLGVNIQCAQCHNHPYVESWKKADYAGVAAFFTRLSRDGPGGSGGMGLIDKAKPRSKSAEPVKVVPAKFLGGEEPRIDSDQSVRPIFAAWATSPKNPYFARAMANRTWGHFFGRGLVNPIDGMSEINPPTHPQLLQGLSEQLIASGFDLKFLARAICNSQTYQRTSKATGRDDGDQLYARMAMRVLTPEQLFDSFAALSVVKADGRNEFTQFFRTGDEDNVTEYERGIPQLLRLVNSPQLESGRQEIVKKLLASGRPPAELLDQLYLTVLARRPALQERTQMSAYLKQTAPPAKGYGDVLWVLMNSSEFSLNH